jgi:hypothetical protein
MAYKSKLRTERKYGAESEASVLVDWLNEADQKHPSLQRVLTVREFLLRLESHARQWRLFSTKEKASLKAAELWHDIDTLFDRLNELLNRYRMTHGMTPSLDPRLGDGGHINWRVSGKTRGVIVSCGDTAREPEIIQCLLNLSRTPYLSHVRQCDHCKRWLYAIRSDQRFCTGKNCNQRHSQTGAGFKKHRRDYMRNYRATLKEMSRIRKRQSRKK